MKEKRSFFLLGLFLLAVQWIGFLDFADLRLQDNHYQKGGLISPEIYVIGIDEETMQEYGSWQNWSRTGTAELLRVLNSDPDTAPAVIGLDIGFFGEGDAEADRELAAAVGLWDNVVTTSYASFGKEVVEEDGQFYTRESVITYEVPYEELKTQVSYGFSNVPVDNDGIVRHGLYRIDVGGEAGTQFGFAAEVYRKYMGCLPACIEDGESGGYIPFAGFPYDFYGSETAGLSFSKVVSGEIPAELFAGAIVLVGPYTAGMMDSYFTAVSHDVPMYGVEVHANLLQAFLDGNGKRELSKGEALLLTLAVMVLILVCLKARRVKVSAMLSVLVLVLYWFGAGWMYEQGYVLPLLYPLGAGAVLYVFHIGFQYVREWKAKKRLEGIFGRYVSKDVAASIVKGGEDALKLGGQKKDIAIWI